jgi:hypothetical protein
MCIQGVEVPYGPLMTGTIRLKHACPARRGLKKADDEIADSTYRKRIQGFAVLGHPAKGREVRFVIRNIAENPFVVGKANYQKFVDVMEACTEVNIARRK